MITFLLLSSSSPASQYTIKIIKITNPNMNSAAP